MALAVGLAGCGSDSTGSPPIDPVGQWSGTTSQALAISFEVTASGVTTVSLSYHLAGTSCSYDASLTLGGAPTPVQNNAFTASFPLSASFGADFVVSGRFNTSAAASGTLQVTDVNCNGTLNTNWTATKQ